MPAVTPSRDPLSTVPEPRRRKLRPSQESVVLRRIARAMTSTIVANDLLAEGDRVLVAVSGGKDSYTLLDLLRRAQRRAPIRYEIVAVHLDQGQPGYDGEPLRRWLERSGIAFEIWHRDTYSRVIDLVPAGKTFCSACSRMRRGILYEAARKLGCNKVALGHHREDAIETLLLNLFYAGRLQAMPARYTNDDGDLVVIRPLIECAESDIREHAIAAGYPILPCNLCSSQSLKRDAMADLITDLERRNPDIRGSMLNAIRNVRPSHLLDPRLRDLWEKDGGGMARAEAGEDDVP